ncbi:polysaccharide biosynthesis tyrosine autokinase [Actinomyces massiliensis]|jgi:capsular exopolysaccharide family|uniref:polysaccharide biosynthesis tyrosine autokinase n=1 Tax=Actinomyces massiliensis TaxID=461393 RepID=UPI0023572E54|nr:polysaccharide biosynthesis tyrosine autokinase [Actinomyces massiliensis]
MTFEELLKLTRRQVVAIAVGLLAALLLSLVAALLTPVSYKASADAYVRVAVQTDSALPQQTDSYFAASQIAAKKTEALVPVFTSEVVAQAVIDSLGLDMNSTELARSLSVTNKTNTLTINVTATAPTASEARSIADETVRQAGEQVKLLEGEDSPVEVVLMSPSSVSGTTRSPSILTYLGVGLVGGVLLGYALALGREAWDKRIRSAADVANIIDRPVLGVIPVSHAIADGQVTTDGGSGAEEAFRKLRTNMRYANVDKGVRTFVVTSGVQGDGKSTVACNLARVMALAGRSVVLIDGDLRRHRSHDDSKAGRRRPGLTQLLVGATSLDSVLVQTAVPGLQIIPAGDPPPNPSELLGSERMSDLVGYLASSHVVIIDAPAALPVTDAVALGAHTDGVLLVVRAGHTTDEQLEQVTEAIRQGGGSVFGVVLNQTPSSDRRRVEIGEAATAPLSTSPVRASSRQGAEPTGQRAVGWSAGAAAAGQMPVRAR